MNRNFLPDQEHVSKKEDSKLVEIKDAKARAHIFSFVLKGDKELIEFGYYASFDERLGKVLSVLSWWSENYEDSDSTVGKL